jgi:phosphoribosylaminoimidazole carboxylase
MQQKIIGIVGNGQLGRMLVQSGTNYPVNFHVYSNTEEFSSKPITASHSYGDLNDFNKLVLFGNQCDIITVEIENVNCKALAYLRDKCNKIIYPQPEHIELIKDRLFQKQFLVDIGVPTMNFVTYNDKSEIKEINYPSVNKLRVGGYDGYGTQILKSDRDYLFPQPSIIEEYCQFDRELAVQIARNIRGEIFVFPPVEMKFTQNNMLDYLICPTDCNQELINKIEQIAKLIVNKLDYIGILAIEMFQKGEEIFVNEMAPRPHNSGHHTQDMFTHSQFDLLVATLLDLPLPKKIRDMSPYGATVNMLGSNSQNHDLNTTLPIYSNLNKILILEDVFTHIYDKCSVSKSRKMGHINILADNKDELLDKINKVKQLISVTPSDKEHVGKPTVGIIMGSISDMEAMQGAITIMKEFSIEYELKVISAHRTPELMLNYGKEAEGKGLLVIIAGAGGAAHLPGMIASCTNIPVIGVPIKSSNSIEGWDSILSILQMPGGVPVATVGLNNSLNAGLLAARLLKKNVQMEKYRENMKHKVANMNQELLQKI